MAGYGLYAVVYSAFGFITPGSNRLLFGLWLIYGVYYAMTEGVEKAFVADIAPKESKATALGFHQTIVGITLLPASIIAGILFSFLPGAPFLFGGVMAITTVFIMCVFIRKDSITT